MIPWIPSTADEQDLKLLTRPYLKKLIRYSMFLYTPRCLYHSSIMSVHLYSDHDGPLIRVRIEKNEDRFFVKADGDFVYNIVKPLVVGAVATVLNRLDSENEVTEAIAAPVQLLKTLEEKLRLFIVPNSHNVPNRENAGPMIPSKKPKKGFLTRSSITNTDWYSYSSGTVSEPLISISVKNGSPIFCFKDNINSTANIKGVHCSDSSASVMQPSGMKATPSCNFMSVSLPEFIISKEGVPEFDTLYLYWMTSLPSLLTLTILLCVPVPCGSPLAWAFKD